MSVTDLRVPPHDMDAEAAVLSAVMLDPSAFDAVHDVAPPEKYYAERHKRIFEACVELHNLGSPCDVVMVGNWLKDRGRIDQVGGMSYLTELLAAAPAVANVRKYAQIVAEKAAVRKLIQACQTYAAKGYYDYGNAAAFFDEVETAIHEAAASLTANKNDSFAHIREAMKQAFQDVAKAKGGAITGTRTGFDDLDKITTGLHGGELTVIAGRPGMGKSALAFQVAAFIAAMNLGAVGSSLEMPSKQVALRLACARACVSGSLTRSGGLTEAHWSRLATGAKEVAALPFWLDDKAGASIANIRSSVRRAARECEKRKIPLGVVVVDYLQLARGSGAQRGRTINREQEIGEISRSMKEIAKEYDVPVLALSQLNRECDKRADKRPLLSDLRESGSIEQDADVVLFVYRDKVYNEKSDKGDVAELIVAKQRQGPLATVEVLFEDNTTSFKNIQNISFGGQWTPDNGD